MALRIALDTNRLTDLLKGDVVLSAWLETCEQVWIPLIVLAEIKGGFHAGNQLVPHEALLSALLAKSTFHVLLPGRETAEHYARLFAQLRRTRTPLPDNDLWIASLAIEHDLPLVTRDAHFDRIPQLRRA